ncbi:MAG: TIGR01244 family sulfur transferase [Pseudomonadota bacterium]|nr:TIGR01244 family sulfur transferase [Pseudomonadota bacterium]
MADIRTVTPDFAVAPQIEPADMSEAKARGFTLVINNRPDGEAPGQPDSAEMQTAAEAEGLSYLHVPVVGRPSEDQVAAVAEAVKATKGPVLAFCRSGTRSIVTWAIGEAARGGRSREDLIGLGQSAGYDLSSVI